jgi:hypothetical protein
VFRVIALATVPAEKHRAPRDPRSRSHFRCHASRDCAGNAVIMRNNVSGASASPRMYPLATAGIRGMMQA